MITVGMCCNDALFDGVFSMIISILRRTKSSINFYLLSGDFTYLNPKFTKFSEKHEKQLQQFVKTFNKNNSFEVIDCQKIYQKYCSDLSYRKNWSGPFTMLRLFVFALKQFKGKIIFLDVDLMFNGDIAEIQKVDMGDAEVVATRELTLWYKYWKKYYNTGVMLIDVDKIRKTQSFKKAISFIKNKKPMIFEQDAINFCCKIKNFPSNCFRFNRMQDGLKKDTIVKHFWRNFRLRPSHRGVRQWEQKKVQNILKIHAWDQDYKIFNKYKKKWS